MNTKNMNTDELVKAINTLKEQIVEYRSKEGQRGDWFYVKMDGNKVLEHKNGVFNDEKIWDLFMNLDLGGGVRTISSIEECVRYNNATSIRIRTSKIDRKKGEGSISVEVIDALRECVDAIKSIVSGDNEEKNHWNVEKNQMFMDSNATWCVRHIPMTRWGAFYINNYEIKANDSDTIREVLKRYRDAGFGVRGCRYKGSNGNGYFSMTLEPMFHLKKEEGNLRDEILDDLFKSIDKQKEMWDEYLQTKVS